MKELYSKHGKYHYTNGFNVNAIITLVAGVICLIGNFVPFFDALYQMSWFVGIICSFVIYSLHELPTIKKMKEIPKMARVQQSEKVMND